MNRSKNLLLPRYAVSIFPIAQLAGAQDWTPASMLKIQQFSLSRWGVQN